jgi:CheY-like chemotaxis protein
MSALNAPPEPCVLIVDDEADMRETLREVVEMGGCSALVAANGADALELLRERRPCLVILDLLMPVMTGEEMLSAMQEQHVPMPHVLISTSAPDRAPPGLPILPKPIELASLWEWMRRSCACAAHAPTG